MEEKATTSIIFFKWFNPGLFFVYLRSFLVEISPIQIEKSWMVCLGFEPGATGW